jgi:hypothetical protein
MRERGSGKVPVFSKGEYGSGCYNCDCGAGCPLSGFCMEHAEGDGAKISKARTSHSVVVLTSFQSIGWKNSISQRQARQV